MFLVCMDKIQAMFALFYFIFNRPASKLFLVKYSRTPCYIWNSVKRRRLKKKNFEKRNNVESSIEDTLSFFGILL